MASALAQGAVASGAIPPGHLLVTDLIPAAARQLAETTGGRAIATHRALAAESSALILCVKPGDAQEVLKEIADLCAGKLLISIVAGVGLHALEMDSGGEARLVRVMPNTPALVGRGAAAYALGSLAGEADAVATEQLFQAVGTIHRVKESLLDAVTGLSGSGPAYVYAMIEALADGGVLMGLPRELAIGLAAQTVAGAAEMVLKTGLHPAILREQVTSPGGTTAAGLEALEQQGLRRACLAAVRAATERSLELGHNA